MKAPPKRPLTDRERNALLLLRRNNLKIRRYKVSPRRASCESDFELFCRTYLPHRFPLPDSDDQKESKQKIQTAVLTGGLFAQAAPRGDGKSSRAIAGALWCALYGHRKYVVTIGATAALGQRLVGEIIQELADNEALHKDWPEICTPIRAAYLQPNRANYLAINGKPARLTCTAKKLVFPQVPCSAKNLSGIIIEGAGILAAFRGLRHQTADGRTLRPSFALLDDLQTRKSASSVPQTTRILEIIAGDIRKLAGPDQELAAVANATVIRRNDAADQLLDRKLHPEWNGIRKRLVYRWPTETKLWEEYARLRKEGQMDGDAGAAANQFYRENREKMDAGAQVGWKHRFRKEIGELSAIQCAYNLRIENEEAFESEMQNEPVAKKVDVYEITPSLVITRLNRLAAGEAPSGSASLHCMTDINRYALSWCVLAATPDLTVSVVGYGRWPQDGKLVWDPKRPRGETEEQAVYRNLVELGGHLMRPGAFMRAGAPARLDTWSIDVGYKDEAVFRFIAQQQLGTMVIASRGNACRNYRVAKALRIGDHWCVHDWAGKGRVLVHDADFWRLSTHQSLLLPAGSPGGITLSGDKGIVHMAFAEQLCAEKLAEYVRGDKFDHYRWEYVPGRKNDYLDALVGARVAASYYLGAAGKLTHGIQLPAEATPGVQKPRAPVVSYSGMDW